MLACMQMFPNSFVASSFFACIKGNRRRLHTGWLDVRLSHYLCRIVEDNFLNYYCEQQENPPVQHIQAF